MRRLDWCLLVAFFLAYSSAIPPSAAHTIVNPGWVHKHLNYPVTPSGYNQIVETFGQPCNANARFHSFSWWLLEDGKYYFTTFHKRLGRNTTPVPADQSTNLNEDVAGHIWYNSEAHDSVKRGLWGYDCRRIKRADGTITKKWSTHAWGIAIDQNAAYEHFGHNHSHTMHPDVVNEFETHRWIWGLAFKDAMHFQYADAY